MRTEIKLNADWLFHKGDIAEPMSPDKGFVYSQAKTERKKSGPASYAYPDSVNPYRAKQGDPVYAEIWQQVSLPHDYLVNEVHDKDENNALGFYKYENAWYRKHFTLPEGSCGKRVLLRFDGVTGQSTIYLNGCRIAHNFSSYNTFELDISDYVYFDRENVIAVYVNVTNQFEGWWYGGAGIYRDVHLTVTDPVAVDLYGVFAPYEKIADGCFKINFETTVVNALYENTEVTVKTTVTDKNGKVAATAECTKAVAARENGVLRYSAVLENALLWDLETPNLYDIVTELSATDGSTDKQKTRTGFRTVEFTNGDGILLNGKKIFINGVCCHQDYGLSGLAMPENVARYKISLLKEMGANGYRTSHYQQTEYYLDALDEMGFLVMNEARWFENTEESRKQLQSLIKRDRNRPSVIMWSTGNEEPFFLTDCGRRIHKAIAAEIKKLDPTRAITAAQDRTPESSTLYDDCDLIGINYNLNLYEEVHERYPDMPLFASECAAAGTSRDWFFDTSSNARRNACDYDVDEWFLGHEKTYKFLRSLPYVFGQYLWTGIEYRGEAVWPRLCSISGAIDLFLQKKPAFYQNLSHWTEKPMAHIAEHWNFQGLEGQDIKVTVYTNCDSLELFLNGKSCGIKQIEKYGRGVWSVPYEKGTLSVKGYVNGELAAEHSRTTTGKAVRLKFKQDTDFRFNGEDFALFTLEAFDEDGNAVPDASPLVHFTVSAPAVIVGTGSDNADHIPVSCPDRKMYMGKIAVCVKPQKDTAFTLAAYSDDCGMARITLEPEK